MQDFIEIPRRIDNSLAIKINFNEEELTKDIGSCRSINKNFDEQILKLYQKGASVSTLLYLRTNFIDKLLIKIYSLFNLDKNKNLALVAVGGYGRKELFLRSDIDFLILYKNEDNLCDELKKNIESFISFLWDIKLDIGSSVRDINSCVIEAQKDITIRTNLLETRLIHGNNDIYQDLLLALKHDSHWTNQSFLDAKINEQIHRHTNYKDYVYTLEPDVKNNLGGIRDLQTILWIANFSLGASTFFDMYRLNLLTKNEFEELNEVKNFIYEIRFALHTIVPKPDNRLTLDRQKQVAATLGYGNEGNYPVERMMKGLFLSFKKVRELCNIALQVETLQITGYLGNREDPVFIDNYFVKRNKLLDVIDPDIFKQEPHMMLEIFYVFGLHKDLITFHINCIRALREARKSLNYYLIEDPKCRECFKKILSNPICLERTIPLLNDHRFLSAYMPQWEFIEGQTQFDMFHIFSVDEHTIQALRNITDFINRTDSNYNLFKNIYFQIAEPFILITATLLHDIAKGRGGNHATQGARDAIYFCQMHGYTQHQQRIVSWLVQNHLIMSATALRRDITDFEVINDFAIKVDDEEHLNLLYCLSVIDIAATNAREWTSWKESMFKQLFFSTRQALRHGLAEPTDIKSHAIENKQLALRHINNVTNEQIDHFWSKFHMQYFIQYTPFELAWHARNIITSDIKARPLILFAQNQDGITELLVFANQEPLYFANVVCTMAQKKLNIQSAQIVRTSDSQSLCTIKFQTQKGAKVENERLSSLRKSILKDFFSSPKLPEQTSQNKALFNIKTSIVFIEDNQKRHTNLEISTLDTPGLLAKIVVTLNSLDCVISTARITTTGERADDFFAISNLHGKPLSNRKQEKLQKALLNAVSDLNEHS